MKKYFVNLLCRVFNLRKEDKQSTNEIYLSSSDFNDNYLFDFKNWSSGYTGGGELSPSINVNPQPENFTSQLESIGEIKLPVKPIDIVHELENVPNPFSLQNLEEKIAVLKVKEKLIVQHYAKREITGLLERIENRKKYNEFKAFFDQFANTTEQKVDELLEKYKKDLTMKTSDIFIPEFPDVAITVMQQYTEVMEKICNKKPVFYVIAEHDKFRKAYEKRDPILLVQSPFGFYWQILGAWDKEMILLNEL